MGMFVNPDNLAFQAALNARIYVDKKYWGQMNIPVLVSVLSGGQETDWQLFRIQEISPI